MSVEAVSWALSVPVGGNAKVILLGLANHAHPDGTNAFPALDTLKVYAYCDRSTVRRNLRRLEADGWIVSDGLGPKGQTKWLLPLGGSKMQWVAPAPAGGGTSTREGVAAVPPEPSVEPSKEPSDLRDARTSAWPNGIGDDTATPNRVLAILREVAVDHGAGVPTQKAVGHVLLAFPDRAHEAEAHAMASWFAEKTIKRVAPTYRNWLKNADPAGTGNVRSIGRRGQRTSTSEAPDWLAWADENLPEFPRGHVASAAAMAALTLQDVTADAVRARLHARFPELREVSS